MAMVFPRSAVSVLLFPFLLVESVTAQNTTTADNNITIGGATGCSSTYCANQIGGVYVCSGGTAVQGCMCSQGLAVETGETYVGPGHAGPNTKYYKYLCCENGGTGPRCGDYAGFGDYSGCKWTAKGVAQTQALPGLLQKLGSPVAESLITALQAAILESMGTTAAGGAMTGAFFDGVCGNLTTSQAPPTTSSSIFGNPDPNATNGFHSSTCVSFQSVTHQGQPATEVVVADQSGFSIGDGVRFEHGGLSETTFIVKFGSIIVQPALSNAIQVGGANVVVVSQANSPSAGNDPVVWFGKESKEFWLPVGKLTPLLHTRHLNMLASTFVGSPREQWIDRIVITNADGFRLAMVEIKKDISLFNVNKSSPDALETIDVTLGMQQRPLKAISSDPSRPAYFQRLDVSVTVERLDRVFKLSGLGNGFGQKYIGKARREAVIVTSPGVRFLIASSPATEYFGDFVHLSVQYAHLDIHVLDMKERASLRGVLPELWGLKPMSNKTKEFTCPPWSETSTHQAAKGVDVDMEWNSNFFQV